MMREKGIRFEEEKGGGEGGLLSNKLRLRRRRESGAARDFIKRSPHESNYQILCNASYILAFPYYYTLLALIYYSLVKRLFR